MRIGIIGAGVSGLAAGRMLARHHEVEIYERNEFIGGIAAARMVDGVPYHVTGGHCLNSKNSKVMEFVHQVLPKKNWHPVERIAKISFRGHLIDYPIEFSMRQIAEFDRELAFRMTRDFLSTSDRPAANLEEWFRIKFGDSLAEEYFIPYNAKIWGRHPSMMSPDWVDGKLPQPNKQNFFNGLISSEKDEMPHAYFYYPEANTQNAFLDAMAEGLEIFRGYEVSQLEKAPGGGWRVNGDRRVDAIISTAPLNLIPFLIADSPSDVKAAAGLLRYNKVSNVLWESEEVEATWTYFPESSTVFHRHIHIGNFLRPRLGYTITEAVGDQPRELLEAEGKQFGYLKRAVDFHVSDHAYVVFDENYSESVKKIKAYLTNVGIHTLGRFGEWEYYNMDICIEKAMQLAARLGDMAPENDAS
ncbi:protoporphyrinogen/coproporphyrinogen oxidase [Thiobacillus sedimenti]|uniref:FAD-dependent oxidoreductase n=1 Tax=Thiobacillus sedimenti TaxID=3110231 RepID=A0ABZ1CGA2_9PROT|nr:FAD-dependent oxidoreductase [Thiobacillus sp. SCUT-2]WRS38409.1 FAD-dependent oxidoreductase [Thiobacillus sp. SCUT-2]